MVVVSRFQDGLEILRSGDFRVAFGANSPRVRLDETGHVRLAEEPARQGSVEPQAAADESWIDFFHGTELHFLNEPAHTQRRRALAPLLARDAHLWFRNRVILPTLEARLGEVLQNPGSDGVRRTDMVSFMQRLATQVAAALVGIDGADTKGGVDALLRITRTIDHVLLLIHDRVPVTRDALELALENARTARAEFRQKFYAPSFEARRGLVARTEAGELPAAELPHDLLTTIARGAPTFEDEAGLAQATAFLSPVISGHTSQLLHALADLLDLEATHPGVEAWREPAFMDAAVAESIRLHHPGVIPRQALADKTLASGVKIKAGQYVAIPQGALDRDPEIFGEDAERYDPHRDLPAGVYRFGLGFGSGSHMCIAQPLVMGQKGITGSIAPVLTALLEAGISRDPDCPARMVPEALPFREIYATFPVVFARDQDPRTTGPTAAPPRGNRGA